MACSFGISPGRSGISKLFEVVAAEQLVALLHQQLRRLVTFDARDAAIEHRLEQMAKTGADIGKRKPRRIDAVRFDHVPEEIELRAVDRRHALIEGRPVWRGIMRGDDLPALVAEEGAVEGLGVGRNSR